MSDVKEDILKFATGIYHEAFHANCCFDLIKQYRVNAKSNRKAIAISPAFYSITYDALQNDCIMTLARIYDEDAKANGINRLWSLCNRNRQIFPERNVGAFADEKGNTTHFDIPYTHHYRKDEIDLIRNSDKKGFSEPVKRRIIDCSESSDSLDGVLVETSREDFFNLYSLKKQSIKTEIEYLKKQRNKIYAHNDRGIDFNTDEILSSFPLNDESVRKLIQVALDISRFVIVQLNRIDKSEAYQNIKDWENTLTIINQHFNW